VKHRAIGSLDVSVVGLGCNNFGGRLDASATRNVVHAALDADVNFFDTATIYGGSGRSEQYLGQALRDRRAEAVIASKFGHSVEGEHKGGHPEYVAAAANASLARLGVDCIDLYQLHQPDPTVPIADTLGALQRLIDAGKVREIGCSNFSSAQLREADVAARRDGGSAFASVQNEYSLFHREPEADVLDTCAELGIAFVPFFPLANGLLTGKYRADKPIPAGTRLSEPRRAGMVSPENLAHVETLITWVGRQHHTLLELAFVWLLRNDVVASVIAGATSAAQIRANAGAADWQMTAGAIAEVESLL
jgi:aryl-alcohol dehydrogenase-like predicted oxidoreductase